MNAPSPPRPDKLRRPIWLRRDDRDHVVVLIEEHGEFREIIRERIDGEFSHIWEDNS
jgi:hypothetical protein